METKSTSDNVTFDTTVDISQSTKDGIYMNGYLVNIDYDEIEDLNGKKIRITGQVTIVEGLEKQLIRYDDNGNEIIQQGRQMDTKLIEAPRIEIIDNLIINFKYLRNNGTHSRMRLTPD
ncbi:MAG: hypothetical protein HN352_14760 [Bacteroidetes bacterium]|nr:hypothetical protein [Bacteroidota bacterium]MBT3751171.1 hypothetical protein [Bacteroidota bacterium]MBT4399610.1 hypothetical protein [Bacteroidota bacterium]MBT4409415.1 hypothetical protein [Bacteroidota bacterium]MBT5425590.1 hypothetical protein [Bacteroidota bacterium]